MTEREYLEFAAKAAGIVFTEVDSYGVWFAEPNKELGKCGVIFNPLTDDGDAFRLAVKCGISVLQFPACIGTGWPQNGLPARLIGFDPPYEDISSGKDVFAATRRAITRAAAELGKNL